MHLVKDEEVEWSELKLTETRINRHTKALVKIVNLGEQHSGQGQRITGATKSVDSPAPVLYLLWKDHKPYTTEPPTRPVCAATVGPLARASELASLILTAHLDSRLSDTECHSTEEMQRAIIDANQKINDDKLDDIEVFSMDVNVTEGNSADRSSVVFMCNLQSSDLQHSCMICHRHCTVSNASFICDL